MTDSIAFQRDRTASMLREVDALTAQLDQLTPEQIDANHMGLTARYHALNQELCRPVGIVDHGFQSELIADLHRKGPTAPSPITFAALGQMESGDSIGAQLWIKLRWPRGARVGPPYRPFDCLTLGEFFDYHARWAWCLMERGA